MNAKLNAYNSMNVKRITLACLRNARIFHTHIRKEREKRAYFNDKNVMLKRRHFR